MGLIQILRQSPMSVHHQPPSSTLIFYERVGPFKQKVPIFKSPKQCCTAEKNVSKLDWFDLDTLRRTATNFHIVHKDFVTINELRLEMKSYVIDFKNIFRWQKTQYSRKTLVERHVIRLSRMKYLRKITEFRKAGRPIVYTDKTYIHRCSLLFTVDQK